MIVDAQGLETKSPFVREGHVSGRTLLVVGCLNREAPYFKGARGQGIYAVGEVPGRNEGVVAAYRLDPTDGRLSYINEQGTLGNLGTYVSFDSAGRFLLIANYSLYTPLPGCSPDQAIAVMPIHDDGRVGAPAASRAHQGSGPNAQGQERSHPHCILATPDNRHVVVADLGTDRLMVYAFDAGTGQLKPGEVPCAGLPPGSGPRHLVFHPSGGFAYVINELDSTIAALAFDQSSASFRLIQSVPTLPADYRDESHCADLQIAPDGRFLYGSNRGHDSIVILRYGDVGRELFIVQSGKVEIIENDRVLETLSDFEVFGEMALIDSAPRSATAVAVTDASLVPVSEEQFLFLISSAPQFVMNVMRVSTRRLRERELRNELMNVDAIIGSIGHDIRQPLAAIVTNASAALRFLKRDPPDYDEVLAKHI
jgi:6-phosphogluconolactonase (cycloisomerase 2 family)